MRVYKINKQTKIFIYNTSSHPFNPNRQSCIRQITCKNKHIFENDKRFKALIFFLI